MRIWDIDPGYLNDKSLLGEHREIHGLFSIHVNGKKGYARHPETVRWKEALTGLSLRHDLLVSEMTLRGFNHQSPLTRKDPGPDGLPAAAQGSMIWPEAFIDTPRAQFDLLRDKYRDKPPGRIPLPADLQTLWAGHKYSVMARDPERYRAIGPLVARKALAFDDLSLSLVEILRHPPSPGRLINALDHMWGYVSDKSPLNRKNLGPGELLAEIRFQAQDRDILYLLGSTALGELGAWISVT